MPCKDTEKRENRKENSEKLSSGAVFLCDKRINALTLILVRRLPQTAPRRGFLWVVFTLLGLCHTGTVFTAVWQGVVAADIGARNRQERLLLRCYIG